jgi:hypothetical protein
MEAGNLLEKCNCRCRARSKRTGERCRHRPEPGYRVCRFHGIGSVGGGGRRGGRPILHARYSSALRRLFDPWCRSCGARLVP